MPISIQQNIPLALLTTIQLGGNASKFVSCASDQDIIDALTYAQGKNLPIHILGGGSNTVFSDTGFSGLVIHIAAKGISHEELTDGTVRLTARAGENWDNVVQYAIEHNFTGIECLSGIPGSAGGTPYQNVGAYGQDVSETIETVCVIDRSTHTATEFSNQACEFGYRTSRFKTTDKDKYIITAVSFILTPNKPPIIKYPELQDAFDQTATGQDTLQQVRDAVLTLRKKKSMVIDKADPNSISCGSFFTNPIITEEELAAIPALHNSDIPQFPAGEEPNDEQLIKLSAGWLIEHAGFSKGMQFGNVGISTNHSLALINRGGTTEELLTLAKKIQEAVKEKFEIQLEMEPVVVL